MSKFVMISIKEQSFNQHQGVISFSENFSEHIINNYFPFTNEVSKEKSKWGLGERKNIVLPALKTQFTTGKTNLPIPCLPILALQM